MGCTHVIEYTEEALRGMPYMQLLDQFSERFGDAVIATGYGTKEEAANARSVASKLRKELERRLVRVPAGA